MKPLMKDFGDVHVLSHAIYYGCFWANAGLRVGKNRYYHLGLHNKVGSDVD